MNTERVVLVGLLASAAIGLCVTPLLAQEAGQENAAEEQSNEINLSVGETKTISAEKVKNYSEGVKGVIDVKLTTDARQFVLVGRSPGSTTLLLIANDGSQRTLNINVFARSPELVEGELSQLLKGLNVKTRRIGSQIIIDGVVGSQADLDRVQQVVKLYPKQVMSLVHLPQEGAPVSVNGEVDRYLIRIDFYFVQYDKTSSYALGMGWPDSIGAGATAELNYDFLLGSTRSATASVASQPLPRLDIASRHGWAKVLKHATVVTNNDSEAKFNSGGEQNFAVNTGLTIGLQTISFGTDITVMPHYDPQTRELGLKLEAESSDLTSSVAGTALPGRSLSKLTTNVSLKLGQSLVLSGIRSESLTQGSTGLPGLSEIPILGFLFGSHTESSIQSEGAIFVVPSVVQSVPAKSAELVDLAIQKFKDFDGDIDEVRSYDRTPGGGVGVPK